MSMIILTKTEIVNLTGERSRRKQMAALVNMGIRFDRNPAGDIVLLRSHVEKVLASRLASDDSTPDFEALQRAS